MNTRFHLAAMTLATAVCGTFAAPAQALTATVSAQDLSIHVNLLGLATLDVTPQIPAQITASATAAIDQHVLPSFLQGGPLLQVSTGVLTTQAEYRPGPTSVAGGEVEVANLNLSAVNLIGTSLLSVSADVIKSQATVGGYCMPAQRGVETDGVLDDYVFGTGFDAGNLGPGLPGDPPGDDATLGSLAISILGIDVPQLPLNPAPNTPINLSVLGIAGATLVLNEQIVGGDGVHTTSKSSNAVHLSLNVAGLITADIVVAHSDAALDCSH